MKKILIKGNVVGENSVNSASVLVEKGKITHCDYRGSTENLEILDFSDCYIMPSFIELHAHGGNAFDFIDNTNEAFEGIFKAHLSHGVARLCPTLCTCDFGDMLKFLELCEEKKDYPGFAGVHLEGPFLSPKMSGAQNLSFLKNPDDYSVAALLEHSDVISRITVAPELEGAFKLADKMVSQGVSMSIGHSDADAEIVNEAFKRGFNSITHLYSSCSARHKIGSRVYGGIIEAALADDNCYVELIGDGHHVSRENLKLTMKCKGMDRVCIVSDAMRAAGSVSPFATEDSPVYESYLGAIHPANKVVLEGGVAKLCDRSSFAGSLAIGDTMVKALCGDYGFSIWEISKMMSEAPARLLGLTKCGKIELGYSADITVLNKEFETVAVFRNGEICYQ